MPRASSKTNDAQPGPVSLGPERFSPSNRRRLSAPGLRTFLAIADLWGLAEEERRLVLGLPSHWRYRNWVKAAHQHRDITLDVDVLMRISAVLGIHQALSTLFNTEQDAIAWLRGPHRATVFGGKPPLALVTGGTQDGLLTVRRFLDGACRGQYMAPNEVDAGLRPYADADIVLS
jgi:hypothetical protein